RLTARRRGRGSSGASLNWRGPSDRLADRGQGGGARRGFGRNHQARDSEEESASLPHRWRSAAAPSCGRRRSLGDGEGSVAVTGTIVALKNTFGFIGPDGRGADVFFAAAECLEPMRFEDFKVGTRVRYDVGTGPNGRK